MQPLSDARQRTVGTGTVSTVMTQAQRVPMTMIMHAGRHTACRNCHQAC
jgi:hypothetical protein